MDIRIIKKIHEFISTERTGSPKELSNKLCISQRTVYNYISYMKMEMDAPIVFDMQKGNYFYHRPCLLIFKG
ncbi:HTH domain-containing protein [Flavobacterium sp. LB2P6]|uniref:HTH domain-containing protein n=1 Tax=Flavobacterium sp. LB2P6 TaxID=3401714 RepID=UPI003AAE62A1